MRSLSFAKGHGTGNDFVILRDRHDNNPISAADVRRLCDRHFGIGADGVLRAVKAVHIPEWDGDESLWFMDYRNADGSIAEMCGNGLRVFARYLLNEGLIGPEAVIATRAGARAVRAHHDGRITIDTGRVSVGHPVTVTLGGVDHEAVRVDVGNPHAVVLLPADFELASLDLTDAPLVDHRVFPHGVNVEFVVPTGERRGAMRVHERGVGETLSCGTGTVAAAAALASRSWGGDGDFQITVPGGRLLVHLSDGGSTLTGPAVVVAKGDALLDDR